MVKLEWQCGWEEWQSPILDAFADSEEEVCCGNIVRLRKRTANNSKKRKRGTVERNEWEILSSPKLASVVETVPKQLVSEDKNENTEPSQLATIIPDPTPISEETQVNHPPSEETKESTVGEETFDSNNVGISKDVALPPTLTNNNRHTLWQRLSNALEKRCKQYSLEGFSPPGFVVDTVPDLKVRMEIRV